MRVKVNIETYSIQIQWWPSCRHHCQYYSSSWLVHKGVDYNSETHPAPIAPAHICPGTTTPYPCSPEAARLHAGRLMFAARLAEWLDQEFEVREDFKRVEVEECAESSIETQADLIFVHDRQGFIEIHIPDQSEYRAEAAEREA